MPHQTWIHVTLPAPYSTQLDQILTSTEALLASTSYDSTSQVVLFVEPVKHLPHLLVPGKGDAVHLLLAIDCDEQDIVGRIREDDMGGCRRRGLWLDARHCAVTDESEKMIGGARVLHGTIS